MDSPIRNEVGAIFVPVKDILKARDWYCRLLGLPNDGPVQFGHLYTLPINGVNVVLDSKIYNGHNVLQYPAFHFNTDDIAASYEYMKKLGANLLSGIEHDHYFTFKDPDGNVLMVCKC
ncbi:glyoxalase [Priestia megaterium]|nr:glyoxalase [Priestia megaterium]